MGYFGMIDIVDTFVFFDDVQFEKSSWQSRNRIKLPDNNLIWLSVPSIREGLDSNIKDIRLKNFPDWRKKHWLTIHQAYHKAPFFAEYSAEIENIYQQEWNSLCRLNIAIIEMLTHKFELNTPHFISSSELAEVEGKKTDRVLSVLEKVGADEYISTEGTKVYLETEKFKEKGIKLYWYNFKHPVYPQMSEEFVPYLSAIDLLFNTGGSGRNYIREGLKEALTLQE